jgi:hypothetical protein
MEKPKPYRLRRHNVAASVHMHEDCFAAVVQFAKQSDLSISGAIHKLLRSHPIINLPELQ